MNSRRAFYIFLGVLALFLLGTVVVLSSVTYYLAIDPAAFIEDLGGAPSPATNQTNNERIPRIIHQTWKTDTLPARWQPISQACRDMMSDYKYMLWTDNSSREFIAEEYPWFLSTFDNYKYPIQRADAIRYFILHHYGGVYMDLDIGCLRPIDPLLVYSVILPKTIPVGVSNDLIFAEKGHPFLEQTIHNLVTFDHSWILNYPTVMFSTGPMFLSAQYGIYTTSHPNSAISDVRILPKSLYGKNANPEEAPHAYFSHFYGSSWHADDAAFIGFLGTWGKRLMWIGLVILVVGIIRFPSKGQRRGLRRFGGYDISLPHLSESRSGRWYLPLGRPSTPPSAPLDEAASSRDSLSSESDDSDSLSILHLPFSRGHLSPPLPEYDNEQYAAASPISNVFRRLRNRMTSMVVSPPEVPDTPVRHRRQRDMLFFLPAIFAPINRTSPDIEMETSSPPPAYSPPHLHPKGRFPSPQNDLDHRSASSSQSSSRVP